MSSERELGEDTSALPGGNKITHSNAARRHWRQILGIEMPQNDILEELAEEFFATVDWFMMVSLTSHVVDESDAKLTVALRFFTSRVSNDDSPNYSNPKA